MSVELRPFRIGDVEIGFPVVLAPLAGYTDLPYRRLCRRLGAAYCATEMLLDKSVLASGKLRRRLLARDPDEHPLAGQLIGGEPDTMARAAEALCREGFDVIDLNFACPVRKALSRGRGGHMMRDPDRAVRIARAVLAAVDRPVTLKLRRAFAASDGADAFWRIAEASLAAGAAGICVHGRSVEQKYTGPADWDFLAEVRGRLPKATVIGSGDALTPGAALDMLVRTGVDGAAAARGVLGNPWFFRQVADLAAGREPYRPTLAEQRELLREHFDAACELYGPMRGPKIMRKFCIRYARMHPTPRAVRMAFVAVKRPDEWHRVLDAFYADDAPVPRRRAGDAAAPDPCYNPGPET